MLTHEELEAVQWALKAVYQALEPPRSAASADFAGFRVPTVSEMLGELEVASRNVYDSDRIVLGEALSFALNLYRPNMEDLRAFLQPPPLALLEAADRPWIP